MSRLQNKVPTRVETNVIDVINCHSHTIYFTIVNLVLPIFIYIFATNDSRELKHFVQQLPKTSTDLSK